MERIGLTQLPRRLATHTGQPAPTYRRCFDAAVANKFPAEFSGNRWTVSTADLDVIAAALGMAVQQPPPPARSAKPRRESARAVVPQLENAA